MDDDRRAGPAPGLRGSVTAEVRAEDTAAAVGSGDVGVLATPRVLALLEAATVAAVAPALGATATTVGTRVELDHLRPSPVGAVVVAEAELAEVDGRRLRFSVRLLDGGAEAAHGSVERAVVDRSRFPAG